MSSWRSPLRSASSRDRRAAAVASAVRPSAAQAACLHQRPRSLGLDPVHAAVLCALEYREGLARPAEVKEQLRPEASHSHLSLELWRALLRQAAQDPFYDLKAVLPTAIVAAGPGPKPGPAGRRRATPRRCFAVQCRCSWLPRRGS